METAYLTVLAIFDGHEYEEFETRVNLLSIKMEVI